MKYVSLIVFLMMICYGCAHKPQKSVLTFKFSVRGAFDTETEKFHDASIPEDVIVIKSKVIYSKRPFVDSMSIIQEETKTLLQLEQPVPNQTKFSRIMLIHDTYIFNPPLVKGDVVLVYFNSDGNFVSAAREDLIEEIKRRKIRGE